MSPKEAIHDPVFQLNLLVWMTKDQPQTGYRVRPLFHESGFELHYIEQPFPFPELTRKQIESAAQTSSLLINLKPEPELTIQRASDNRAIYFEAKAQGFSVESSNSKQARGHLLACGPAFAEVYKPLMGALLNYVVPVDDAGSTRNCLKTLLSELRSANLAPGDFSVDGLSINGRSLDYHLDQPVQRLLNFSQGHVSVMTDIDEKTDPSPLLLVFSEEDCPNAERAGHYRRVLLNQVLANLLCMLHRQNDVMAVEVSAQELLKQTTIGVFDFIGRERQKRMERMVVENLFRQISDFCSGRFSGKVRVRAKTITFDLASASDRGSILDWLERITFEDRKPNDLEQPDLPHFSP